MLTHGQLVPQLGGTASMSAGKGKLPIATQPELGETAIVAIPPALGVEARRVAPPVVSPLDSFAAGVAPSVFALSAAG